jgi:hypothetical protein
VIIQWCVKGMSLPDDAAASAIIDERGGLVSNWWRDAGLISPAGRRARLTPRNVDMHVNHFTMIDPTTQRPFNETTPFISLSAGTVERDAVARTNYVRSARQTALRFGTEFGLRRYAYLFTCWVILGPRQAVEIEGVAEEVRDLNTYRRYSAFQTEGEVLAKVIVPDNHIEKCERWELDPSGTRFQRAWMQRNPRFTPPEVLINVRRLI